MQIIVPGLNRHFATVNTPADENVTVRWVRHPTLFWNQGIYFLKWNCRLSKDNVLQPKACSKFFFHNAKKEDVWFYKFINLFNSRLFLDTSSSDNGDKLRFKSLIQFFAGVLLHLMVCMCVLVFALRVYQGSTLPVPWGPMASRYPAVRGSYPSPR